MSCDVLPSFSINELSVFSRRNGHNMSVALKAYYDGSGTSSDPNTNHVTLAGFAGSPDTWAGFDEKWPEMLRGDGSRPSCHYLHMVELWRLAGEYEGWTAANRSALLQDAYRFLYGHSWNLANNFRALVCTVCKADYSRACGTIPRLSELTIEDICVDRVGMNTLQMIPNDEKSLTGKAGAVELFFDQNEPFRGRLMPRWTRKWSQRGRLFKCIAAINEADMRLTPGLQAADYIAWSTNRYRAHGDIGANFRRMLSSRVHEVFYGYDALVETYQRGWEA